MSAVPLLKDHEPVTLKEWQVCIDGVFIKQMHMEKSGTFIEQHRHAHAHTTMLATGRMRVWVEGVPTDYEAPFPIHVKAGAHHTMMALEDNTMAYCIHNLHGKDETEILPEMH